MINWISVEDRLPEDKQEIIVYDEGLQIELHRIFYIDFWKKNNRILFCSHLCKKWKPRTP